MKKPITFALFLMIIMPFGFVHAGVNSEVHITKDGSANISGVKIMQLVGSSFYTRLYWGDAYVRMTVKTNTNTKFFRGTGELTTISEIKVDDLLDVTGTLESGSDSLTLVANTVKNSSVQKQQSTFSGKVLSVDQSAGAFSLTGTKSGTITVNTNGSTVFTKGNRTLDLAHVLVGDTITKTSGDYDLNTKILSAVSVTTYVDMNKYKPQNYEGILESVAGASLPTTVRVSINKVSHQVVLSDKTTILNKNKNSVLLSRFVPGDKVRLYGTLREIDDVVIDAEILRNLNL